MTLTFDYAEALYSVYLDRDGDEVLIAHGPGFRRVVDVNDLDLGDLYDAYVSQYGYYRLEQNFRDHLRSLVTDPDDIDTLVYCEACSRPGWEDDLTETGHGGHACEPCWDEYWSCHDCDGRFRETSTTLHDTEVCEGCRDAYYIWCDDCDAYYHRDYRDEHRHNGCSCESEVMHFKVRNDGQPLLANDERATITLPAGVISDEGIRAIGRYMREIGNRDNVSSLYDMSYDLSAIGSHWQTKEGNYTKRLSRYAYKQHGLKITPEVLSGIGNIASDHSRAIDFEVETTRNLNLSAGEFYHEDSCWWQSYAESRCALKTNGGFGLRTFGDYDAVKGRAWVMPLRLERDDLVPTYETQEPDAFVVFNGYGDLSGYTAARIVSHMAGWTYRKIDFSCSPMYVNGDSGYIVAPEEIAEDYTDGSLSLAVDKHSNLHRNEMRRLGNVA